MCRVRRGKLSVQFVIVDNASADDTPAVSAPRARSSAAGGMQGTARLTGQTIGALTMTIVFTLASMDFAPRIGFGIAAGLTLIAGLVSTLRAPEAA